MARPKKEDVRRVAKVSLELDVTGLPRTTYKVVINEYSYDPTYFVRGATTVEALITAIAQFNKENPGADIDRISLEEEVQECTTLDSLFKVTGG